jgi:hypothetical protein
MISRDLDYSTHYTCTYSGTGVFREVNYHGSIETMVASLLPSHTLTRLDLAEVVQQLIVAEARPQRKSRSESPLILKWTAPWWLWDSRIYLAFSASSMTGTAFAPFNVHFTMT